MGISDIEDGRSGFISLGFLRTMLKTKKLADGLWGWGQVKVTVGLLVFDWMEIVCGEKRQISCRNVVKDLWPKLTMPKRVF